ncbi:MAG TPA: metallopeptidase family protein [Gemmatimonadota bacterium]|nr:metallopeptidase family protein [Gemmatimonadota bacterium]
MIDMTPERFETLVARALGLLPPEFEAHMENVSVVIEPRPPRELLESFGSDPDDPHDTLFGLYEGVPLIERRHDDLLLPDQITIYREPLLEYCASEDEVVDEVRITVLHEIGHFFGMDEDRLDELGYG